MTGRRHADCGQTFKGLYSVLTHHDTTAMRYSSQVKPISYLKANAAEVLTRLAEQREPLVITQNGEAKAVLQDVASFEETQQTLAANILDAKKFVSRNGRWLSAIELAQEGLKKGIAELGL